jgi:transcriptional regulator with XRE-family HTH domain
MTIASALCSKQRRLGLSVPKLAKRLKVSIGTVYKTLAGSRPNARTAKKFAKFLEMSVEKVLGAKRKSKVRARRGRKR